MKRIERMRRMAPMELVRAILDIDSVENIADQMCEAGCPYADTCPDMDDEGFDCSLTDFEAVFRWLMQEVD